MKKLFLGKIVKICKFYSWKSGPFFNYKMVHFSLDKYIIQNRCENGLPIIITTRFDKEGLIERFSYSNDQDLVDATISKLYQMCYGITLKSMKKELV